MSQRFLNHSMNCIDRYYEILGLQPGAALAEIKQAYRELAKQWHPDRFAQQPQQQQQAEAKLKRINEAYRYLKDYQPETTSSPNQAAPAATQTTVSVKPTNAEFWYNRGSENLQAGRYKPAIDDFSMAVRMNPAYMEAYRSRGFAHSMLGFELGAEADLQQAKLLELERRASATAPPPSPRSSPFKSPTPRSPSPAPTSERWRCLQTLSGHSDAVTSLAVSRDEKFLVSGSQDRTIKFWNLRTHEVFSTLAKHTAAVTAIALSADGQLLATGSAGRTILLWDLKLGNLLRTLIKHTGTINALAFSPDKRMLVSGGQDGMLCFWSLSTSRPPAAYQHDRAVLSVAISANGQLALSSGNSTIVNVHHAKTGELLRTLSASSAGCSLAFSPDGGFATGGQDGTIELWADSAIVTGDSSRKLSAHAGAVRSLCFSPNGQRLASGGDDRAIQLWLSSGDRIHNGKQSGGEQPGLVGHSDAVTAVTFSANGQILYSSSADNTIKLWQRQP